MQHGAQWEPPSEAERFDNRAGLPAQACKDIAEAVLRIGGLTPEDLLLEIGAGTGQIGEWLSKGARYTGFDQSATMIGQFRRRLPSHPGGVLHVADGSLEWPVAPRSVSLFFSSRAIHLLPPGHVRGEISRAAQPGAFVVFGRIFQDPDSWQAAMRGQLRRLLGKSGFASQEGRDREHELLLALGDDGATAFEPVIAAEWTVDKQPLDLLSDWGSKKRLGGMEVSEPVRKAVLDEMARWVEENFAPGGSPAKITARYVLKGVRLASVSQPRA